MINKVALLAASMAAAIALVVGLVLSGFNPGAWSGDPLAATTAPQPKPTVQVDTVYLTSPTQPPDVTVTRTVTRGDDAGEREGRGDD